MNNITFTIGPTVYFKGNLNIQYGGNRCDILRLNQLLGTIQCDYQKCTLMYPDNVKSTLVFLKGTPEYEELCEVTNYRNFSVY